MDAYYLLLFIKNILPFLIGFKAEPTGVDQIWKMRAIYHRFDGLLTWKRDWSMVYLPGNEAASAIDHRSTCFPSAAA